MATQKPRTYARHRSKSSEFFTRRGRERIMEPDGVFFLKLITCVLLGALWLRLREPVEIGGMAIAGVPVGLIVALLLVTRIEKYQFNRKIWYSVLVLVGMLTAFVPVGILL